MTIHFRGMRCASFIQILDSRIWPGNNVTMPETISSLFLYLCLWALCRFESHIEHKARRDPLPTLRLCGEWTLPFFKTSRTILLVLASLEAVYINQVSVASLCAGLSIILLGISMRVLAIVELGPMWSFHVAHVANQKRIHTGIYRVFRHPAYIGNMYIVGLLLLIGAPCSAVLALAFVVVFYIIRVSYEERLLEELGS